MDAALDPSLAERITCALCGFGFVPSKSCASGCPMGEGCGMIRCPNCRYEFVERSQIADGLKKLFTRVFSKKKERP